MLAGTVLIKPSTNNQRAIDLGYSGLAILDRENQLVLSGFAHPRSRVALDRFGKATSGVLSDVPGLDGAPGHVVAFARSPVSAVDRDPRPPRSEIFGNARRNLWIELAITIGAALFGLALLAWILVRVRAETRDLEEQARRSRVRYEEEHRVAIDAAAQSAVGDPARSPSRLRSALPGGKHRPRGRRRLVRRRRASRRDRAHHGRRRGRARRVGGGAHGTAAQRIPRLRLRPHLAGRDHVAAHPPHGRRTRWRRPSASRSTRPAGV